MKRTIAILLLSGSTALGAGRVIGVIGDSIAEGYPNHYTAIDNSGVESNYVANCDIVKVLATLVSVSNTSTNVGRAGFRFDLLDQETPWVTPIAPTDILVHCGINDIIQGKTWAQVVTGLNTTRDYCTARGARMWLDDIFPSNNDDTVAATVRLWNSNFRAWAATNANVTCITSHDAMGKIRVSTGEYDDLADAYNQDGTHLTAAGNAKWAILIAEAMGIYDGNFYISAAGSDTNSGRSISTSWLTLSNVSHRTYAAGDSIFLKAGDSFDGPLVVTNAGSSGARIEIASYSTGAKPKIYGDHPSVVWGAASGFSGYYTNLPLSSFANVQLIYDASGNKYFDAGNRGATSYATWLATFTNNCWGKDNETQVIYVKSASSPSNLHLFDALTLRTTAGHAFIHDLEVRNGGDGIYISGQGTIVSNNVVNNCFGAAVKVETAWNSELVSNTLHNSGYTMIYMIQPGGSNLVHFNTIATNSSIICGNVDLQSLELNGIGLLGGTNNLVERNSFSWMAHSFLDYFYEANSEVRFNYFFHGGVGGPGGTGLSVHHNVFDCDNAGSGIIATHYWSALNQIPSDTGPVLVYNNTFNNFRGDALYCVGTNANGVNFRNNIFVTTNDYAGGSMGIYTNGLTSDYNLFYSTGIVPRWKWGTTIYNTLADFVSASSQEAHSIYTNAGFASSYPTTAQGFQLRASSRAINAGVAYGDQSHDFNGNPTSGIPDIGAFEYAEPIINNASFQTLIVR